MSSESRLSRPAYLRPPVALSDLDRALIVELQSDGRRSFADLARQTGATERRVRARVEELTRSGVMTITAVTDPRVLGYDAGALIGLELNGSRGVQSIVADLMAVPQIDYVVVVTGRFAIYVEVFCRNRQELLEVSGTIVPSIPGVGRIETFPYLSVFYQQAQFASAGSVNAEVSRMESRALDGTDLAILKQLAAEARVKAQHIARDLEVSESQIRKRIRRMTDEGAMRVIAIVNPLGNEFTSMAWVALRVQANYSVRQLATELTKLPFVTYLALCAGRFDIFAEVAGDSTFELLELLENCVRTLPGISDIEVSLYLDLEYRPLLPAESLGH